MTRSDIVQRARAAFHTDMESPPPLTLRGGNDVDSYAYAQPFDPAQDEPTDSYLEVFAFWGVGYLDAQSWRHYLPRLMDYALRRPDDPAMVTRLSFAPFGLGSISASLASLTAEQRVVKFLELLALTDAARTSGRRAAARKWWLGRAPPDSGVSRRVAGQAGDVPPGAGTGYRLDVLLWRRRQARIPQESRRLNVNWLPLWRRAVVAVNVTPRARSLTDAARMRRNYSG